MDDDQLLREFVGHRSEEAFRALVDRHINFVYSVAFRQLGDPHRAEEVAQLVFIDLAAKASRLPPNVVLAGWLFRATRFAASKTIRSEIRRQQRERQAAQMDNSNHHGDADPSWGRLEPLLNEALEQLSELDRNAVLLRFFEKKGLKDVAAHLGMNEGAARKRLTRAVEKLRTIFVRRGVAVTSAALATMLLAQATPAAPVGLAASITGAAIQSAAIGSSTLTIGEGILKIMAISKLKIAATATVAVLLASGTAYVVQHRPAPPRAATVESNPDDDDALILRIIHQMNSRALEEAPPRVFLRASGALDGREGSISTNGKFMGKGVTVAELLAAAYRTSRGRLRPVGGVTLPEGRFDYLVSVASGQREALQQMIRERLGLTAHVGTREEDVYVLTALAGEFDNLRPNEGNQGGMRVSNRDGEVSFRNATIDTFARNLEQLLPLPVVDESGLRGRFDGLLHLSPPEEGPARKPSVDAIRNATAEQLGLELQPGKRELEVLLVESAPSR